MRNPLLEKMVASGANEPSRRESIRFLSTLVVCVSLCCVITAFAVRGSDNSHFLPLAASETTKATAPPSPVSRVQPSTAQQTEHIQAEVVVIRRTGIEPATITRPKGRFLLLVYNRSGLSEVGLRLDRVTGALLRLHDVRVPNQKLDWRSVEDLNPGDYVLTEASHPGWACHITITPK